VGPVDYGPAKLLLGHSNARCVDVMRSQFRELIKLGFIKLRNFHVRCSHIEFPGLNRIRVQKIKKFSSAMQPHQIPIMDKDNFD